MNILFVSYGDFHCNSTIHVAGFANQLARMGHACAVAVPQNKESASELGESLFKSVTFSEVNTGAPLFDGTARPDLIHCWTPREIVRKFAQPLREKWGCKLAVHLEDNEEHLLEQRLQIPIAELRKLSAEELDRKIPNDLSHPQRYLQFLESADGATVIIDRLKEFLPYRKPVEILWPGVDPEVFGKIKDLNRESEFPGISAMDKVVAYTGNVHEANRGEVASLYFAVGALNKRGISVKLLRTGEDFCPFLGHREEWVRQYEIKLGRVAWTRIPRVLAAADIVVQPGGANAFNDYRLPSKLPEFMAAGKPILLSESNLGRFIVDGDSAILLRTGCAHEIASCAESLFKSPQLCAHLSSSARRFASKYFNWESSGKVLENFYGRLMGSVDSAGDPSPLQQLTANPESTLPEDPATCNQLTELNFSRWSALMDALRQAEERNAKLSNDCMAAKTDFETRLHKARLTKGWRFMRFLRRFRAMVFRGEEGGIRGFLKWLFKRPGASQKSFDPFDGAKIHDADFNRSLPP